MANSSQNTTCVSFLNITSISECPDVAMLKFSAQVMRLADITYRYKSIARGACMKLA